jgi:hypothetical protein
MPLRKFRLFLALGALTLVVGCSRSTRDDGREVASEEALPPWSYDAGPNPNDPMGRELIDLTAEIPDFPQISEEVTGDQKFRPVYGPIPWRMQQKPNSVKILFIGQDGTHIAEAAGRPATAGFGGRAQDLAKYFGVGSSAAFINAYAFTIKGQYGSFGSPYVRNGQLEFGSLVENPLWLISQDLDSPIVQWRNHLIEWIIRNNRDSLKMIVLFGGAARDAAGAFVASRGGEVGTRFDGQNFSSVQVPEADVVPAFSNKVVSVPLNKAGKDIYAEVLGRSPDYSDEDGRDVAAAQEEMLSDPAKWVDRMVFSRGGPAKNGVISPAQLGGYDIDRRMSINGKRTISLKGLRVSNDLTIGHDLLVVQLPHPTALSMMTPAKASQTVAADLAGFEPYVKKGWKIEADPGFTNTFAEGKPYRYSRADMGPEYYDFGAPASRMVNVSTAARDGANVIIFGTRDKGGFGDSVTQKQIRAMTDAKPSRMPDASEMWTTRPRGPKSRYVFDPGPGEKYARIMKENIPETLVQKHDTNKDFGHYRGTFVNPKVIVVADPDGYDDLITARALTGTRGQYLHGLMEDLGVGDQYLVFKTAPFSNDNPLDWQEIVSKTDGYREAVLRSLMKDTQPLVIFADGETAVDEVKRILGSNAPCPIVNISRGANKDEGIVEAGREAVKVVSQFAGRDPKGRMSDIPRSHLTFYARIWEGTSGDRVISSRDPSVKGTAFAVVAPSWAYKQKPPLSQRDRQGIQRLKDKLEDSGLRKGGESIQKFLDRVPVSRVPAETGLEAA